MGVEVTNPNFGRNGHADTFRKQMLAHHENSRILINLSEGREADDSRPAYDPTDEDNQWPKALHHASKGFLSVGKSLKGMPNITDDEKKRRIAVLKANSKEYSELVAQGWQSEPFPVVQIAVLDPKAEKLELQRKNDELQGQISTQQKQFLELQAQVASLLAGKAA